jgi:hypothetical protein
VSARCNSEGGNYENQLRRNAYRSGRRFLRTDNSWPVFLRLPAFPVKPTRTSSSNSPPIFSLHSTHTSVSGSVRRRAGGIGVPHRRQSSVSSFIPKIPSESNPGVEKASEPARGLQPNPGERLSSRSPTGKIAHTCDSSQPHPWRPPRRCP